MRKLIVLLLFCLYFPVLAIGQQVPLERAERGNLVIEGIPDIPQRITSRLNRYQNIRSATLAEPPLIQSDSLVTPPSVQSRG